VYFLFDKEYIALSNLMSDIKYLGHGTVRAGSQEGLVFY
jgi:hypothetical protein